MSSNRVEGSHFRIPTSTLWPPRHLQSAPPPPQACSSRNILAKCYTLLLPAASIAVGKIFEETKACLHAHQRLDARQRVGVIGAERRTGAVQALQQQHFGVCELLLLLHAIAAVTSGNSSRSTLQHRVASSPPVHQSQSATAWHTRT
jgi:hypothetical protein